MKCSIVILNWNGAEMLRRYLPSVVQHTQDPDYEVVVADNGSTDDSLTILKKEFPTVRTIVLDRNYGFAEGYNRAIAEIEAEYCVLLNSDVEVTENWLSPILHYMDSHPQVAAAQPKILSWLSKEEVKKQYGSGSSDNRDSSGSGNRVRFEHAGAAGGYMDKLGYPYCRGRILGDVEEDKGQYDTIAEIFWATGACMCVRTYIYKELGGLDADFFAHMEEIDLCWRMQSRGYKLVCIPEAKVYHLGGGALGYENPRKTYLNFRNNMLMLYKNCSTSTLLWLMPVRLILDYVAALQMLITGKSKNAMSVLKARRDFWQMRKQYQDKRKENLTKAIADVHFQTTSILWLKLTHSKSKIGN